VLLAISPVPPWPVRDGMSLRVSRILQQLSTRWAIVLISPPGGESAAANGVPLAAELSFPKGAQWMYVPSQYEVEPVVATVQAAVKDYEPAVALLWGGMEYLHGRVDGMPQSISDRVDSMTLSSWRMILTSSGWRDFTRRLAHLAYVAKYEFMTRRASRAMAVVGEADASVLRRFLRVRDVHVIPNGVDVSGAVTVARSANPTVMFTGVLNYTPNTDAVMYFVDKVWPTVLRSIPTAVFQIVGRAPTPEIEALRGRKGVEVIPDVGSVPEMLAQAWLATAPMRTGCGIKNKILEAWSVATPVVMTPLAINGLDAAPAELLLTGEGDELAHLTVRLLSDAEERARLGALGRTIAVEKFSWKNTGQAVHELLAQTLSAQESRSA
jgi:glycosyltransferase involved in cell wall biosynthesis